jgi:hypothetical protein
MRVCWPVKTREGLLYGDYGILAFVILGDYDSHGDVAAVGK